MRLRSLRGCSSGLICLVLDHLGRLGIEHDRAFFDPLLLGHWFVTYSLMARLDRLGTAKVVAQIAAAVGREFSHALLAEVVRMPEVELAAALDRLMATGCLFRQGVPPHATPRSAARQSRTCRARVAAADRFGPGVDDDEIVGGTGDRKCVC
jgi:hypothetical protein